MIARGRGPLATAAVLALLPPVVYWRMLRPGWAPIGYDLVTYFVPLRRYLAQSWAAGRWVPLWDPGLFMGAPFLANIQDAALYPPSLLFALLPAPTAIAWSLVLHLAIAGTGMFAYALRAERLRLPGSAVAGLAYMLGGYMNSHMGHLNQSNTLAWTPWLMLATDRLTLRPSPRRAGLLALLVAAVVLAGHTQQAYFSFLLAGLVAARRLLPLLLGRAWRPALLRVAAGLAAAVLGGAAAALQLLATLELTPLSIRAGGLGIADAAAFALPARGMFGAVLPDYAQQQNTEWTAYVGMVALSLAILAVAVRPRRRWPAVLAGLGVLAAVAALGTRTPLYSLLYHLVPGIGLFRVPGRLLLFTYVAGAILAGHGVRCAQQLAAARARGRQPPAAVLWAAGLAALPALAVIGYRLLNYPDRQLLRWVPAMNLSVGLEQLAFVAVALALALVPALTRVRRGALLAAALPVAVAVELVLASAPTEMRNPEPDSVYNHSPAAAALVSPGLDQRFLTLARRSYQLSAVPGGLSTSDQGRYEDAILYEDTLHPDTSLGRGGLSADGYDGGVLPLAGFVRYRRPVIPADSANFVDFPIITLTDRAWSVEWLRDSGVETVITAAGADPNPPDCPQCLVPARAAGDLVAWQPASGPLPTRAFVLAAGARLPAHISEDTGERVRIRVDDGPGGTLVLSDAWYPGWTATVDGRPVAIARYQGFLRAVPVPAGAHQVEFAYRPWWLVPGAALSILALVAALALVLVPGRAAAPVTVRSRPLRIPADLLPAPLGARLTGARALAWFDGALIALGLFLLWLPERTFVSADAVLRFQALERFVKTGVPAPVKYQFVGPLFATPLWYLGQLVRSPQFWMVRYNLILFALMLLALWWLLRDRVDRVLLRLFMVCLVGASMFPFHTQDFLGETFTTVLVAAGVVGVALGRQLRGWAAIIVGTANVPATVPAAGLLALRHAWERRRLRYLAVPALVLVVIAADTYFRRHELLVGGYLTGDRGEKTILPYSGLPGFSYPFGLGLLSILFSFGKGLVFFAPGLLLTLRSRIAAAGEPLWRVQLDWITYLAGMVLIYASWWAWYGGWSWGPRFFLFASVPASLALAAAVRYPPRHWLARLAVVGVATLSVWVAVNGIVWGVGNLDVCLGDSFALEHLCWYVPDFSVLWRPFTAPKTLYTALDKWFLVFAVLVLARLLAPLWPGLRADARRGRELLHEHARGWRL